MRDLDDRGGWARSVQTGEFGADMKVSLTNDGPVTIMIDSIAKKSEESLSLIVPNLD
jgi:hypothetical protein